MSRTARTASRVANPTTSMTRAIQLSEKFHGRKTSEIIEISENEIYPSNLAKLGDLIELSILVDEQKGIILPIHFERGECKVELRSKNEDPTSLASCVNVSSSPNGDQLYFVGGDQSLDLDEIFDKELDDGEKAKRFVLIGPVHSIVYWTDKHHLEGPKYQKTGAEYEHEFGEENGELPNLVYDRLNHRMMMVGGSYKVEEEGIKN